MAIPHAVGRIHGAKVPQAVELHPACLAVLAEWRAQRRETGLEFAVYCTAGRTECRFLPGRHTWDRNAPQNEVISGKATDARRGWWPNFLCFSLRLKISHQSRFSQIGSTLAVPCART